MITRNFKQILVQALPANVTNYISNVPIINLKGETKYICNRMRFPYSNRMYFNTILSENEGGISVGTGGTPPTEFDYNLENTITQGINLTLTNVASGVDSDNSYLNLRLTVVNTSNAPIIIKEIGYKQSVLDTRLPLQSVRGTDDIVLIDRTVLDAPLVLQPNDAGTIEYKLQTNPMGPKYKEGIKLVSWTYGTDEEIIAIINAARQGIIDLQADAGWHVGDVRQIDVGAWTDGAGTAQAAGKILIAISQFGDYNSCGSIFQYDVIASKYKARMNATNTTVGGYKESEMKTVTLPALFQALPQWLKSFSKDFDVLASKGGSESSVIETVTGNKLALRSEIEIIGTVVYSQPGEGTQIDLYKNIASRPKRNVYSGASAYENWWGRSSGSTGGFCIVNAAGQSSTWAPATSAIMVAPFGCI